MPKGIFLVEWDAKVGFVLKTRYPTEIEMDSKIILQYASISQFISKSPTIQMQDESHSTLIYGIPSNTQKSSSKPN